MSSLFIGTVIEESLEKKKILKQIIITKRVVEQITDEHKTPWVTTWTIDRVEIPENKASKIAKELSGCLDSTHNWYSDFKNDTHHYIVFRNKVFYVDRTSKAQYERAKDYGISLGIPEAQLNFASLIS